MSEQFPTVILCDHLTQDVQNKHSAIGIYSGDISVSRMPADLRLSLFLIFIPHTDGENTVELEFSFDEASAAKGVANISVTKANAPVPMMFPQMDFNVTKNTNFRIYATVAGGERELLLDKKIYIDGASESSSLTAPAQSHSEDLEENI